MMSGSEYWKAVKRVGSRAKGVLLSFVLCAVWLTGCAEHDRALVLDLQEDAQSVEQDDVQMTEAMPDADEILVYVHVCGAVVSPGVVELEADSRVEDALLAAGGFLEDAAMDYVNLAARVEDGQQLYFPTKEEAKELAKETACLKQEGQVQGSGVVNINTAGTELLCTLPGIGEARARDIIAYREAHGSFQSIEDIMQVSGIKQSVFEKLCDSITVD